MGQKQATWPTADQGRRNIQPQWPELVTPAESFPHKQSGLELPGKAAAGCLWALAVNGEDFVVPCDGQGAVTDR
jgi:hypothetical protein